MFDLGMTEMLVIVVVAIIVVGPKDLPGMLRTIGKYVSQIRSMAREFQGQVDSALKEAELDGVTDTLRDIKNLNPVNTIKSEVDDYMSGTGSSDGPDEADIKPPPKMSPDKATATAEPIESSSSTAAATSTSSAVKSTAKKGTAKKASEAGEASATTKRASSRTGTAKKASPAKKTNGAAKPAERTPAKASTRGGAKKSAAAKTSKTSTSRAASAGKRS
ncbi:MAG: Sec-independent protein translocase protein TatB [Pseudomonadota bacterium]